MDQVHRDGRGGARRGAEDHRGHVHLSRPAPTGLDAAMPPWAQDGGYQACSSACATRRRARRSRGDDDAAATTGRTCTSRPARRSAILLVEFKNEALKPLTGKTLAEVAKTRGKIRSRRRSISSLEDESRVGAVYFLMSEENIKKQLALPWVSFGSDAARWRRRASSSSRRTHPRAYGNFARAARQVRARREGDPAGGGDPPADGLPADESRARPIAACCAQGISPTSSCSTRRRSRTARRSRSRTSTPSACARLRQRRAGPEGRRAHRRDARPRAVGSGRNGRALKQCPTGSSSPEPTVSWGVTSWPQRPGADCRRSGWCGLRPARLRSRRPAGAHWRSPGCLRPSCARRRRALGPSFTWR